MKQRFLKIDPNIWLVLALSIFAWGPLLTPAYFFEAHDARHSVFFLVEFDQTFRVEVGSDNTFSESVTSITARLIGALNLVASYTIRNNSDVPLGTEKTDTRTAVSLEYAF